MYFFFLDKWLLKLVSQLHRQFHSWFSIRRKFSHIPKSWYVHHIGNIR